MDCSTIFTTQEKIYNPTKYQHSDRISSRRKALFPSITDENNDDLGPMSLLSDTNSNPSECAADKDCNEELKTFKDYFSSFRTSVNNYVIIDDKTKQISDEEHSTGDTSTIPAVDSVTCFTPVHLQLTSQDTSDATIQDTPLKESPTKNLKTPHDTSNCNNNVKVPKLVRKHNGEFIHDIETGKHNFSPTNSPCNKVQKLENNVTKTSKVRTALFPEISLPVENFYPKSDEKKIEMKPLKNFNFQEKKHKVKSTQMYLCNRRLNKNRFGQINAGVRHKIRKPKQRVSIKMNAKKAAMSVMQSSYLVEYIKEMKTLSSTTKPKLINNLAKNETKTLSENENELDLDRNSTDPNRKFFKSGSVKSIVTITPSLQFEVEKKDIDQTCDQKKNVIIPDVLDFINDNDEDLIVPSLDKIIDTLDEENMFPPNQVNTSQPFNTEIPSSQIILKASNTINESDNSILFHHPHEHSKYTNCKERKRKLDDKENESVELLLSPTSQMCDMASGLAINSPKRAKLNITDIIEKTQDFNKNINIFNKLCSTSEMEKQKLFPIFYPSHSMQNKDTMTNVKAVTVKKWKSLPENQMLLDAGQKRFGIAQCPECEIIYHMGDPNDEIRHMNYHNAKNVLSFKGWKNENVVGCLIDARIIKVSPEDPKVWWKKVKDLVEVINRDLGYYEMEFNIDDSFVFLYIKNKSIVGCVIAESKREAFKMLSSFEGIDVCSKESYPIKCGISRIWVSSSNRRKGVGTAMMDCVRANFSYGYVLRRDEMALSSPSELGKTFAKKYFQTDNYLIYTS